MGVKDLIKKMEDLAAEASSDAAPSHKTPSPATEPAVAKRADAPPNHSQPALDETTGQASSTSAANGPAQENGAPLPAAAAPGKEPEDPEKKAKKVEKCKRIVVHFSARYPISLSGVSYMCPEG